MKKLTCAIALLLLCLLTASTALAACASEDLHRYGPWKTKTSATCTRQGHEFRYCQKCDHWEQRRTAKLPHTPGEITVTKEPTCTETGTQEAVCQVCEKLVRYTIDKLPHAYGEMTVVKEPTCVRSGKVEYTCADCGKVKDETIDKLGHDWGEEAVVTAPTCKKGGAGEIACQRCGETKGTKIARLEHVYGEWTVTREPDGKRKGLRTSACTLCGEMREESFYWEGTLYQDMEACEEVIRMQEMLRDLDYYKGAIRSGQFGKLTTSAVIRFQEDNLLEGTGVADAETLACLRSAWEQKTGKSAEPALDSAEMENAEPALEIAE